MTKAIIVENQEIKLVEKNIEPLKDDEILLKTKAIGVNFFDINQKNGKYSLPEDGIIGIEAACVAEDCGKNVEKITVGQRLAYATAAGGAYSFKRKIHKDFVFAIPDDISDEIAAASLTKGLMAHMLLRRTFFVRPEFTILVHSAAGGIGSFLCQLGKLYGAKVIGTVGSDEKKEFAKKQGCDLVLNYETEDYVKKIMDFTNGIGVQVVYDSVGKKTFLESFKALGNFGLMAIFGDTSGAAPLLPTQILTKKSQFLTRPSLFRYKENRAELVLSAHEVFTLIKNGNLRPNIYKKYDFQDVKQAHFDIENRKRTGSSIIVT